MGDLLRLALSWLFCHAMVTTLQKGPRQENDSPSERILSSNEKITTIQPKFNVLHNIYIYIVPKSTETIQLLVPLGIDIIGSGISSMEWENEMQKG